MASGKAMPVDVQKVSIVTLNESNMGQITSGYVPHWATCPHADRHRKGGKNG